MKRCFSVLSNILLWCKRTCICNLLFDIKISSQCLHVKILMQVFCALVKNRDIDENWTTHFEQIWYRIDDEKSIIIWSKLIAKVNANENVFAMIVLKSFSEMNSNWFFNHVKTKSRKFVFNVFNTFFSWYLIDCSFNFWKKFAQLTKKCNFDKFIIIKKSKKSIFLTKISNLIVSITATTATTTFFFIIFLNCDNNVFCFKIFIICRCIDWYRNWICNENDFWFNDYFETKYRRHRIEIVCKFFKFECFEKLFCFDFWTWFKIDDDVDFLFNCFFLRRSQFSLFRSQFV